MSKSVLVIDTPESCYDCPFRTKYYGNLCEYYCILADRLDYDIILVTEEYYDWKSRSRPDWCPLKPLLKYKSMERSREYEYGKMHGWNNCIDKIING